MPVPCGTHTRPSSCTGRTARENTSSSPQTLHKAKSSGSKAKNKKIKKNQKDPHGNNRKRLEGEGERELLPCSSARPTATPGPCARWRHSLCPPHAHQSGPGAATSVSEELCKSEAEVRGPASLRMHLISGVGDSEGACNRKSGLTGTGVGLMARRVGRGNVLEGKREAMRKKLASRGGWCRRAASVLELCGRIQFLTVSSSHRPPTSLGWWPLSPPAEPAAGTHPSAHS